MFVICINSCSFVAKYLLNSHQCKVLFQAVTSLIINNHIITGSQSTISPEKGSGIGAKDVPSMLMEQMPFQAPPRLLLLVTRISLKQIFLLPTVPFRLMKGHPSMVH